MTILSANNINKSYGLDVILDDVSFNINKDDKVGIIGANGEGKSTLLNILTGSLTKDSGEIFLRSGVKIGYLRQEDSFNSEETLLDVLENTFSDVKKLEEEINDLTKRIDETADPKDIEKLLELQSKFEDLGGYTYKSEIKGIVKSMGFSEEEFNKSIALFSGGERTRVKLIKLLLEKPDILLLDEPTNHLDIKTLRWLENYLLQYKGTIIVVSHDRYFLDKIVNRIFEIRRHKLTMYDGNYTEYVEKRRIKREIELKEYLNQQKEIKRQEDMIRIMMEHNTEHLVKRAQSRMKRLDMIDRLEKPENELKTINFSFNEEFESGNDVLHIENLSKRYGTRELFNNVNLDIKRGERICIVGDNGIGKTTLLKIILQEESKNSGEIKLGHNVKFGYYDQGQLLLNEENTLLNELKDEFIMYSDTEMRKILGRFLFTGDDVFLKIKDLSGGEKARLSLCKLMLSGSNTLLLDEPTNHLDIDSKEIFEEELLNFDGTLIIVSHDRYFLKKIPSRIVELTENGLVSYLGNYDYYVEKKEARLKDIKEEKAVVKDSSLDWKTNKDKEREERKKKRKLEETEKKISSLENEISEVESDLLKEENAKDYVKLKELSDKLESLKSELNLTYEMWEEMVN